ncbi:MAG: hypothetical protein ABH879_00305 [archaeon]
MKIFSKKRIIFMAIFLLMVFAGNRINFAPVIGMDNQFFTLFQFFGPIAGAFLGPVYGVLVVLLAELGDFLLVSKTWSLINLVRLTPMLFAAYYFGKNRMNVSAIVPLAAMAMFILHPVGRQAWFFSLYWLIPVAVKILQSKYSNLYLRSLGATFTAHAVGSVAWLYTVPMDAGQWTGLIPIVAFERLLFAAGIAGSFYAVNIALDWLSHRVRIPADLLHIDRRYLLSGKVVVQRV